MLDEKTLRVLEFLNEHPDFHDIAGDTQPVDRNAFARIKIVEEPKAEVDVDGIYDFWWLF